MAIIMSLLPVSVAAETVRVEDITTQAADEQSVTITFHVNGGKGSNATITRTPGKAMGTLPTPTRAGHTFLGWFPAGSGTINFSQQILPTTLAPIKSVTYFARWGQHHSKTLTHGGSMLIQGFRNTTHNSNWIAFNGSAIPANARVDSISINTGLGAGSGGILGNHLEVTSTARPGHVLRIPWDGRNNAVFNNTQDFWNHDARALYDIRWNGTVIANTIGSMINPNGTAAIRGYSNVRLTINYTVPV
jgi:uncharacterized repeat protein (TIGR02543 family)